MGVRETGTDGRQCDFPKTNAVQGGQRVREQDNGKYYPMSEPTCEGFAHSPAIIACLIEQPVYNSQQNTI